MGSAYRYQRALIHVKDVTIIYVVRGVRLIGGRILIWIRTKTN